MSIYFTNEILVLYVQLKRAFTDRRGRHAEQEQSRCLILPNFNP